MQLSFDEFPSWKPVSRLGAGAWLILYTLFLIYAWFNAPNFLFPDFVNLMIHEAGHLFFSWGGHTIMLLGGTLGELLAPLLCGVFFFLQREPYGFAFCGFWFFENFLYIGTYMADARNGSLPLINGDIGDWTLLFGQWRIVEYDQRIGNAFRFMGWLGMLAVFSWLAYRLYRDARPVAEPRPLHL